ncbi:hypothetical protein BH20ACT3_BH20ACT3_15710 [soil metagenome]
MAVALAVVAGSVGMASTSPVEAADARAAQAGDGDNVWLTERRVANMAHAGGIFEAPQNTLFAFKTAE